MVFVYVDLHFRFLDDGSFKTHVFIWREGISHVFWRGGKEREVGFYNQQRMRVHKNTLSLLGYPSRVKQPFSGPPIFFKKESRLLLDKSK
jgi:hypothetical protein